MLTSCPECRTSFRVTQEHLSLRRGLVRCGQCGVVFNAYDSLLAELVAPPEQSLTEESLGPPDQPGKIPEMHRAESPPTMAPPPSALKPAAPPVEPFVPVAEPAPQKPRLVLSLPETSESILLSELPRRGWHEPPRPGRWLLPRLTALFLFGLLLLQLAIFLRADIATSLPDTRPTLQALCQPLGCEVPLPHQLDKRAIAASSLEHDAENKSRARLSVLLANRGDQAQAWPQIVLILTDIRDAPVAQRVFSPREYLAQGTSLAAGMAPGKEQEIRLDLDTGTLEATGYALDLAYR